MNRSLETFSSAGTAMAVLRADGRFSAVNPALCELLGRSRADLLIRSLDDVTELTGVTGQPAARRALLPDGTDRQVTERRLARRDGSARWVRVTASRTTADDPGAVLAIVEDVTERRHAEQRVGSSGSGWRPWSPPSRPSPRRVWTSSRSCRSSSSTHFG